GKVYHLKVHEVPDAGRTAKGVPIVNVINIQPDETVTTLMRIKDFSAANFLFFTTRLGRVKRVNLSQFQSVRASGLIAIGLEPADELAWVRMTNGDQDVILITEKGQAIRFHETDARAMGRPAAGVTGIRLAPKDRVIAFEVCGEDCDVLVIAARGLGKRTQTSLYPRQGRGGKGVQAMKLTSRTGDIVAAGMVKQDDTVMMMSNTGIVIRIPASQISRIGRATQGVTLMRLGENEQVVTMTIIEPKDESPDPMNALDGMNEHELSPASVNGTSPE
ncbi:MAG: DNA gyrase subunit A, partial [Chloroflexota bacterium]|nr:DNA gyrase subunit A [Chloroflexota bacterium]